MTVTNRGATVPDGDCHPYRPGQLEGAEPLGSEWQLDAGTIIGVGVAEPDWRVTTVAYPHGSTIVMVEDPVDRPGPGGCTCACHLTGD